MNIYFTISETVSKRKVLFRNYLNCPITKYDCVNDKKQNAEAKENHMEILKLNEKNTNKYYMSIHSKK